MKTIQIHPWKRRFFGLVSVLTIVCWMLPFSAWAAETDVSKEMKEAAAAIGEYSAEQRDAAVEKAQEVMGYLDKRIDEMEHKLYENWADLKASTREEYRQSLRAMRSQRNELSQWYGSMQHSTKETWKDVKQGFADTYDNLVESWQKTEKEIDEEI